MTPSLLTWLGLPGPDLALYEAGCRDLKLDDCTWGMVVDDDFWSLMAGAGFDRESLQATYLKLNNEAIKDLPADLRVSTHVCRGNYHSTWAAKGGYGPVADYLLAQENVAAFYLEFDDDRSGDLLRWRGPSRKSRLGLGDFQAPGVRGAGSAQARIKEASQYIPWRIALSTQCGFASEEGNQLTEAEQ